MALTTTARGYGSTHQKNRRQWEPIVAAGAVNCWRCGHPINPGAPWDLGHDDTNRDLLRGPEHQRCNRAVKGRGPNELPHNPAWASGRLKPRTCEVCDDKYQPTYSQQRTCGRTCGWELRRANPGPQGAGRRRVDASQLTPAVDVPYPPELREGSR